MNINEIRADQFPRKRRLLIIGYFKKIDLIPAAICSPFGSLHTANRASVFRVSRKTHSRRPVHTVMPLHTYTRGEREV